ncbi:hypothetical protein Tco_1288900 [Tanacetum coccineum]
MVGEKDAKGEHTHVRILVLYVILLQSLLQVFIRSRPVDMLLDCRAAPRNMRNDIMPAAFIVPFSVTNFVTELLETDPTDGPLSDSEHVQGAQRNRKVEVIQDSNDDVRVAQRKLEFKQLKGKTNTNFLVNVKIHLSVNVRQKL